MIHFIRRRFPAIYREDRYTYSSRIHNKSKIRFADKVLQADYIHSSQGQPVYVENTDNYEDMRQRFPGLEKRFRENLHISKERKLTWIADRGIFSIEMYQWVLETPNTHLITWEKAISERLAEGTLRCHLIGA